MCRQHPCLGSVWLVTYQHGKRSSTNYNKSYHKEQQTYLTPHAWGCLRNSVSAAYAISATLVLQKQYRLGSCYKKHGGTQKSSLPKHCGLVSSKPVLSHPIFGSSCFLSSLVTIHVEPRYVVQLKRPTLTGDATKVQALNLLWPSFKRIQILSNVLAVWGTQPLRLAFGIGGLKVRICVLKALCQKQMIQHQNFSHVTFEACLLTFTIAFSALY